MGLLYETKVYRVGECGCAAALEDRTDGTAANVCVESSQVGALANVKEALLGVAFIFGKDAKVGWGFILAALVLALWVVLN